MGNQSLEPSQIVKRTGMEVDVFRAINRVTKMLDVIALNFSTIFLLTQKIYESNFKSLFYVLSKVR